MSSTEDRWAAADEALANHDWSTAVPVDPAVEQRRRSGSVVHSTRMSVELTERLAVEAGRRGVTPSELIREYVTDGLLRAEASDNTPVTVTAGELHRALDAALRRGAA